MTSALSVRNLTKIYKNGFEALSGASLEVQQGDFFALLGPNGAGKSTLIGIICSLITKNSGQIKIFGTDVDKDFSRAKKHIGLVPQEFNFNVFEPVEEILVNQAGYFGIARNIAFSRSERYLKLLGLWEKRRDHARELSGGMKRRLMIARALMHEPDLLILDEPTAGVDIEIRRSMWSFLRELNAAGTTIILTTHYLEEAESLCRNIAIIDDGRIIKRTSMKQLLGDLQIETFIFDLKQPVQAPLKIEGFQLRFIDDTTLEADLEKGQSINQLFSALSNLNVEVLSMRNKTNRLEQLFVQLLDNRQSSSPSL